MKALIKHLLDNKLSGCQTAHLFTQVRQCFCLCGKKVTGFEVEDFFSCVACIASGFTAISKAKFIFIWNACGF